MLLGEDEIGHSQRGNDNAYCQDNETSWIDRSLLRRNNDVFQFARGMLVRRRAHPVLHREAFYREDDIRWFDPSGVRPSPTLPRIA